VKLTNLIFISMTLAATSSFAAIQDWSIRYYAGTLKILDVKTKKIYKEDVVMYHLNNTELDMVTQMACVSDDGGPSYLVPTHMRRNFDGSMEISDRNEYLTDSNLTGKATPTGRKWNWDRFSLTMKYVYNPAKSPDHKTMQADVKMVKHAMKVRKKVWDASGALKQNWTGTLFEISRERFLKIATEMKCPVIP